MEQLNSLTAERLIAKLDKGENALADLVTLLENRIKAVDNKVNAYVRTNNVNFSQLPTPNSQLQTSTPRTPNSKLPTLLCGIPASIKDNICTLGYNTECCSAILKGYIPPYDATVIAKLKQAGATILNLKTNMDEFAFGSSTENSAFGPSHNPWDLERVVGGSSGGSAAAVAADEAIFALGSDTGGSIRQPAAFCGVVGLKPTYGRVSRYGLIAFASSLDQIGPITKDVADCALLMNVISGYDPRDSTSVDIKVPDYRIALRQEIKQLKVAIPNEYFVEGMDPEVKELVYNAIETIKNLTTVVQKVSLPHTKYAVPVYYIIATAEASSNLARFDGVQYGFRAPNSELPTPNLIQMYMKTRGEGFGQEAKRRILLGTFALSHGYYDAYYLRALKARTLIKQDFDAVFKEFDCIVTPTSPTAAFRVGEKTEDPLQMYLSDIYTISANLAGIPAISIPCGFTKKGLPVGLQILAKPFAEETLFSIAYAYEQKTPWHKMKPKL